jgi:hypothetical protein
MPFDILAGDPGMRETLINRKSIMTEQERWALEIENFRKEFSDLAAYEE